MIYIGCDPGLSGGFAAITDEGICLLPMPVSGDVKREIDEQYLSDWLRTWACKDSIAFIELVHAMPKQGVVSMFTFGTGWGLVRGICAGLGLPYQLVRPQEWQKVMMTGQPKGSEYVVASRLWPHAEWKSSPRCRKAHEGIVDAALIAEYGRRTAR